MYIGNKKRPKHTYEIKSSNTPEPQFDHAVQKGHNLRIKGQLIKNCPARSNYFTNRIINAWNHLPSEVVSVQSVNAFKNRYGRHMNKLETIIVTKSSQTDEPVPSKERYD
jgi:hypothetical protein